MQCEKCHSENTQRLQVAYESGTQNIQTTSHTTGVGIGAGGLGVGSASTTTRGQASSLLASRVAPPPRKRYLVPAFFAFLAWLLWVNTRAFSMWFLLSSAVIALCFYLLYRSFHFNRNVWPQQLAYWQQQWVCLKCGHVYHAPED